MSSCSMELLRKAPVPALILSAGQAVTHAFPILCFEARVRTLVQVTIHDNPPHEWADARVWRMLQAGSEGEGPSPEPEPNTEAQDETGTRYVLRGASKRRPQDVAPPTQAKLREPQPSADGCFEL